MKIFGVLDFAKAEAEGIFGQVLAFLNMDIKFDLRVASVSAKLWALAAAAAGFLGYSYIIGLIGSYIG